MSNIDLIGNDNLLGDEFVGWDEIIGQDNGDDLVNALLGGAAVPPIGAGSSAGRLALAMKAAQAGRLVRTRGPTKSRIYTLGFRGSSLAAAGSETLTERPQVPFKGRRISVPTTIEGSPGDFSITDIRVGKNSQLVTTTGIPASSFAADAVAIELDLDTCQTTMDFAIAITNRSAAASRFNATVVGLAVE